MKVVIATPLYPPDIAPPAPYVKELAKRLQARNPQNTLEVITYGRLPETIPGVHIWTVDTQQPLIFRVLAYTALLRRIVAKGDILYAQNGASVELPIIIFSLVSRIKLVFHIGDSSAHAHAKKNLLYGIIEYLTRIRSSAVISDTPLLRPEILPFVPYPTKEFTAYEESWAHHIESIETAFGTTS
jgi:hypothetical protein